jgi:hypothetical protein
VVYIYLTIPEQSQSKVGEVTDALIRDGVDAPRIRVFSMCLERLPKLAVRTVRYRSPAANARFGALIGGVVGLLIGLLLMALFGLGLVVVLVLLLVLAVGGALSRLWFDHGLARELYRLDGAMRQGSQVIVLKVDKERVEEVENGIKQRHPEVAVLGEDAQGTPPFP